MLIDRILFPITALGPGNRLAIWTIGCSKHCFNCANPELWKPDKRRDVDVAGLSRAIHESLQGRSVDGITITGGDPLEQIEDLLELLDSLRDISRDVIVYTGFLLDEVVKESPAHVMERLKKNVSVLIDGPYIDELNDNACVLRGSTNQRIIYFDESVIPAYEEYLSHGRQIQNVYYENKAISIGIHNKGC